MGLLVYAHVVTMDEGGCQHPLTPASLKMFPVGELAHGGSKRRARRHWTHVSAKTKIAMRLAVARGGFITPVALLFKIQTKDLLALK